MMDNKQFSILGLLFLFAGISGMLFSASFDFFKGSKPFFGANQQAGFVVSAIIAVVGLRKTASLRSTMWDGLLLLVYLAGIFFMGLRVRSHVLYRSTGILQDLTFYFSDVAINVFGFMPLGYLMVSYFLSGGRTEKKAPLIYLTIAICIGISLFLELSQYFLPGRTSSPVDLFFNGLGALGGIGFYLFEKRYLKRLLNQ